MYFYKINRKVKNLLGINTKLQQRLVEIDTKRIEIVPYYHDNYLFLRSKKTAKTELLY